MISFKVTSQDKKARTGLLTTTHGTVETPAFLPVGTQAAVKALTPDDLKALDCQIILGSTYHLYLRPGVEVISQMGGIHKFMNWTGPVFTDSGGFQVFSLGFGIEHGVGKMLPIFGGNMVVGEMLEAEVKAIGFKTKLAKIEEEGPTFQSHIDGLAHFFPPEKSIESQVKIGADFIVVLDELTSPLHKYDYTKIAMERTHRWETRSLNHFEKIKDKNIEQALFGVIQGGPFKDLRIESSNFVNKENFFGVAIGGALVNRETMIEILDWIYPTFDPGKPRHLFGIGTVTEIFLGVERGMDMFDAVVPTRFARIGHILDKNSEKFYYDINKAEHATNRSPLTANCSCYTCQNFTRGYIHHLFRAHELLAYRLASIHNVKFTLDLMKEIREAINQKRFAKLKKEWLNS